MKIRLAKKILFSDLYQRRMASYKPAYWDEKRQKKVVPARKEIDKVVVATKRYCRWNDHKIQRRMKMIFEKEAQNENTD